MKGIEIMNEARKIPCYFCKKNLDVTAIDILEQLTPNELRDKAVYCLCDECTGKFWCLDKKLVDEEDPIILQCEAEKGNKIITCEECKYWQKVSHNGEQYNMCRNKKTPALICCPEANFRCVYGKRKGEE